MRSLKPNIRLLVAEDDEDDLVILRDTFLDAGFVNNVRFVDDGQELLDTLRKDTSSLPDAVLIDLGMPRKDGIQVLEEIRSDPKLSHLPVVIMSGTKEYLEMLRKRYPRVLVDRVLIKPVSIEALAEALEETECCTRNVFVDGPT